MATENGQNTQKRESISQSQSQSNKKSNINNDKFHIPVMDFQDYQAQHNSNNSRDDMFVDFEQQPRRYTQKKRHSIRPASIRPNRASTLRSSTMYDSPLTPMEQMQSARNSARQSHHSEHNNTLTFTDLKKHHSIIDNEHSKRPAPPPFNKPKSIPFLPQIEDEITPLPLHSASQPPSPTPPTNKRVTFKPIKPSPPPRNPNSNIKEAFLNHRGRSQSDAQTHHKEILFATGNVNNGQHNNKALSLLTGMGGITTEVEVETEVTNNNKFEYQIPKLQLHSKRTDSAASSVEAHHISSFKPQTQDKSEAQKETLKDVIEIVEIEPEKKEAKVMNDANNEETKEREMAKAEEATLQRRRAEKKKRAAAIKLALARDLENFQYDQWKKHCIAQTFSLPTLENAFKKYYQHNHVILIKLYIISYFLGNVAVYAFYDIINIDNELFRLITLFIRAGTAIFLCVFGYLFWSKMLIEVQNDAMVVFNLFVAIGALIVSGLGGEPGHGIFIIIMFCIHLFSGLGHLIASAICWFITFGFAIMSAIVTTLKLKETRLENSHSHKPYWYSYANTVSYLFLTALCLSLMGMFIEFSARRQFYQRKKLQHEKKKSWKALSTLLPPDVAKSLQQGRRVAVAFKYVPNHPKYRGVSVGFIQICDFHNLVSRLPSKNLVSMLNTIFTKWDEFASLHRVFKVETINEIYMVAGGLPYPKIDSNDYSHPIRMVFFANDIMNYCHQVLEVLIEEEPPQNIANANDSTNNHTSTNSSRGMQFNYGTMPLSKSRPSLLPSSFKTAYQQKKQTVTLKIRIGLNIGYVVAGVIGKKLPRYRLFGDTVNTASRMESTCAPQQIQMTTKFWFELPKVFHQFTQKREGVKVKGKGEMTTYLLHKIDRDKPIIQQSAHDLTQRMAMPTEDIKEEKEETIKDTLIKPLLAKKSSSDNKDGTQAKESNGNGDEATLNNDLLQLPQLSTIQETGGFFGLITHSEEEEEESVMKSITTPQIQPLTLLKPSLATEPNTPPTPPTNLQKMGNNNNNTNLNININIRIDPPSDTANINEMGENKTIEMGYAGNSTPLSRMKSRRKMKLVGSKRNIFGDDKKKRANMNAEIQKNKSKKKSKKKSASPTKDAYKLHRRNKSLKGLWAINSKRNSSKMKNEKEESHQRSKSIPFAPVTPVSPVTANSLGLLQQKNSPVTAEKKPHKIALKHKMTKLAQAKLTQHNEANEANEENSISVSSALSISGDNDALIVDINDIGNENNKAVKHAIVAPDTDDLFDNIVENDGDESNTDVLLINIQYKDESNTNGGQITPPSAQSSEQTGSMDVVGAIGSARVSSKHTPLESVPEIH